MRFVRGWFKRRCSLPLAGASVATENQIHFSVRRARRPDVLSSKKFVKLRSNVLALRGVKAYDVVSVAPTTGGAP